MIFICFSKIRYFLNIFICHGFKLTYANSHESFLKYFINKLWITREIAKGKIISEEGDGLIIFVQGVYIVYKVIQAIYEHYRKTAICRVPECLLYAIYRAHGKLGLCCVHGCRRVFAVGHARLRFRRVLGSFRRVLLTHWWTLEIR